MTPRRETPLDAAQILATLAAHGVEHVIIGGLAVQAHGHVRTTQDVDVLPDPAPANLERLAAALRELGARPAGEEREGRTLELDGATIAAASTLSLDTDAGGVDVHTSPPGAASYPSVRRRALELGVLGMTIAFAGRDDLIAMKRAAGRPLDRGDILALTEPESGS